MNNTLNIRFSFGDNWKRFIPKIDDYRIARAKESLTTFLEISDLKNKTFVDIGSGSGLFSYAAFLLGADKIVSFDFDSQSVFATKKMWEKANRPTHWTIEQGSALDKKYLLSLGTFDIVYSWGVLHHTGSMWEAIRNTALLTKENGYYCIAIYNRVEGRFGSRFWLSVKKNYNKGSFLIKKIIEWLYFFIYFILIPLSHFKNPLKIMNEYRNKRGMDYYRDIVDWVGGYPYEFASVEDIFSFMKKEFPSFKLVNIKTVQGIGNNWFLFKNES